jgi:hypothetical protein
MIIAARSRLLARMARMVALFEELDDGLRIGGRLSFPGNGRLLVDDKDVVGLFHAWFIEHPQRETPGGDIRHDYSGVLELRATRR